MTKQPAYTQNLSWEDCAQLAKNLSDRLTEWAVAEGVRPPIPIYPIPRGGMFAALLLQAAGANVRIVGSPQFASAIVDDVYDTGATFDRVADQYPGRPGMFLVHKRARGWDDRWVAFPWEVENLEQGPEDNIRRILQYIGEDPTREGLKDTPARVVRSYGELFAGYKTDPASVCKVFEDGACDEMVIVRDVEFYSCCEHHMQPFFGRAAIGYIPDGKVIGVSKLARLLEVYSRRLQIQERLTTDITTALDKHLKPRGSACVIEARHFCMVCRGVQKQNSVMVTSSLTGSFRDDPAVRAEFMQLSRRAPWA